MSQSEPTYELPSDAGSALRASPRARVDAAHVGPRETVTGEPAASQIAAAAPSSPAASAEMSAAAMIHQVHTQAAQLATHLQRQQVSVDHREAELNARLAAMETEIRGARLWLNERHEELARQAADLERREQEIGQREAASSTSSKKARVFPRLPEQSAGDEADYAQRTAELDRRQAELDAMAGRMADKVAAAERVQDLSQAARQLDARRDHLERAEKLLANEQSELERAQQALAEERAVLAEASLAERRKLAAEQQRTTAETDQTRRELARQSDELAARHAALERMRSDVASAQHEALEVRLATEELWARLCGSMAPAALAQSLAQIRLKLADEQRLARGELARQKAEVHSLSGRVAQQHQKLRSEREELQAWATQRQRDLEKQAALLAAGQHQIDQERAAFNDRNSQWHSERFALQGEIRRLLRQSNRGDSAAA